MTIDVGRVRDVFKAIHPGKLSSDDAETIVELAQMSVDADGREDADEIKLFFELGKAVFALAGRKDAPSPSFDSDDDDRLVTLAGKLATKDARELAYAVAHVLTVADAEIAPVEDEFLLDLREALAVNEERAEELASLTGAAITPPA